MKISFPILGHSAERYFALFPSSDDDDDELIVTNTSLELLLTLEQCRG